MADKEIKFTEDELNKIQGFQDRYVQVQLSLGQADITRVRLEAQIESIDEAAAQSRSDLVEVQNDERDFISEINEKYGDGVLDPATGVFTPAEASQVTQPAAE